MTSPRYVESGYWEAGYCENDDGWVDDAATFDPWSDSAKPEDTWTDVTAPAEGWTDV